MTTSASSESGRVEQRRRPIDDGAHRRVRRADDFVARDERAEPVREVNDLRRRDAGKQVLRAAGEPATSCGNTGPQMSTWSYSVTSRLSATGTSCSSRPLGELDDVARGDRAERDERGRVVPAMIEDPPRRRRGRSITGRPTRRLSCASLIGECVPSATRKSSAATRGPSSRVEDLEHQRHRHRARAVRDEDQHALAVERQPRQTLTNDMDELLGSEAAVFETATDDVHDGLHQAVLAVLDALGHLGHARGAFRHRILELDRRLNLALVVTDQPAALP